MPVHSLKSLTVSCPSPLWCGCPRSPPWGVVVGPWVRLPPLPPCGVVWRRPPPFVEWSAPALWSYMPLKCSAKMQLYAAKMQRYAGKMQLYRAIMQLYAAIMN